MLGGEEFLDRLRKHVRGNVREQGGIRRLRRVRPKLAEIISSTEKVKGRRWMQFRDRYGDSGRDLVLYLGRRKCGLTLQELAMAMGMRDYSAVSIAIRRYEKRLRGTTGLQAELKRVSQLSNVEM